METKINPKQIKVTRIESEEELLEDNNVDFDLAMDDNYLYIWNGKVWKRTQISLWERKR